MTRGRADTAEVKVLFTAEMDATGKKTIRAMADASKMAGGAVAAAAEKVAAATGNSVTASTRVRYPLFHSNGLPVRDKDTGEHLTGDMLVRHTAPSRSERRADANRLASAVLKLRNASGSAASAARDALAEIASGSPAEIREALRSGTVNSLVSSALADEADAKRANTPPPIPKDSYSHSKQLKQSSRVLSNIAKARNLLGQENDPAAIEAVRSEIFQNEAEMTALYESGTREDIAKADDLAVRNSALAKFLPKEKRAGRDASASTLRRAYNRLSSLSDRAKKAGVSDLGIGDRAAEIFKVANVRGERTAGLEALRGLEVREGEEIKKSIATRKEMNDAMSKYSKYVTRYAVTSAISTVVGGIGGLGASAFSGGADGFYSGVIGLAGQGGRALAQLGRASIISGGSKSSGSGEGGSGGGAGTAAGGGAGSAGSAVGGIARAAGLGGFAAFGIGLVVSAIADVASAAYERGARVQTDATSKYASFNEVLGRGMRGAGFGAPDAAYLANFKYAVAHKVIADGMEWSGNVGPANPDAPQSEESEARHRYQRERSYAAYRRYLNALKTPGYGSMSGAEGTRALQAALRGSQTGLNSLGGIDDMADTIGSFNMWGVDPEVGGRYMGVSNRSGVRNSGSPADRLKQLSYIVGAVHSSGITDDRAVTDIISKMVGSQERMAASGINIDQREQAGYFSGAVAGGLRPDAALRLMGSNADARMSARDRLAAPGKQLTESMAMLQALTSGGGIFGAMDALGGMSDASMTSYRSNMLGPELSKLASMAAGVTGSDAEKATNAAKARSAASPWVDAFRDPLELMRLATSGGEAGAFAEANQAGSALTEESVNRLRAFNDALDDASSAIRSAFAGTNTMPKR